MDLDMAKLPINKSLALAGGDVKYNIAFKGVRQNFLLS